MNIAPARVEKKTPRLTLPELERAIGSADSSALLVPTRILRRVIRQHSGLPGWGVKLPHRKSFVIKRKPLLEIVEKEELGLQSSDALPETVILLPAPAPEELDERPPDSCWSFGGVSCSMLAFTWLSTNGFRGASLRLPGCAAHAATRPGRFRRDTHGLGAGGDAAPASRRHDGVRRIRRRLPGIEVLRREHAVVLLSRPRQHRGGGRTGGQGTSTQQASIERPVRPVCRSRKTSPCPRNWRSGPLMRGFVRKAAPEWRFSPNGNTFAG